MKLRSIAPEPEACTATTTGGTAPGAAWTKTDADARRMAAVAPASRADELGETDILLLYVRYLSSPNPLAGGENTDGNSLPYENA